jgi:hypothetical protein
LLLSVEAWSHRCATVGKSGSTGEGETRQLEISRGDFTMTLDKGSANNLVSFCGTNVQKTGATTFRVHYTNFTPTTDVHVLILSRTPPK